MTTRPNPKQLATGTPEDGYSIQYSSGDSIWISSVNSIFGRTGDVLSATDDYSASQIENDSTVTGEQISDALEYLDGYISDVYTLPVGGDLSGSLPNPEVTDLTITSEEQGSVLYFDGANWVQLAPGDDGYVLTTHGSSADPTWAEAEGGTASAGYNPGPFVAGYRTITSASVWLNTGFKYLNSKMFPSCTRSEFEVYLNTESATYPAKARLVDHAASALFSGVVADGGGMVGDEFSTAALTVTRLVQCLPVEESWKTYRLDIVGGDGSTSDMFIYQAGYVFYDDDFSLALGEVPDLWPGTLALVVPVTVTADIPWAVAGNKRTLDTGLGTGASQNATFNVPILKDEAENLELTAGGSVVEDLGDPAGGPMLAASTQYFNLNGAGAGTHEVTVSVSGKENRRLFAAFSFKSASASTVSACTLNGTSLTAATNKIQFRGTASNYGSGRLFQILDTNMPASGSYTFTYTNDVAIVDGELLVFEICDAPQSALVNVVTANGSSTAPAATTTTAATYSLVFSVCCLYSNTLSTTDYVVPSKSVSVADPWVALAVRRSPAAEANTITWTCGSNYWLVITFNLGHIR